jgi:hypothetical protein
MACDHLILHLQAQLICVDKGPCAPRFDSWLRKSDGDQHGRQVAPQIVLTVGTDAVLALFQSCRFLAYSCRSLAVCTRTLADFSGTLCPRAEWSPQSESANNSGRRSRFGGRWNPGSVGPQDCCPCSNAGTTCNGDTRSPTLSTAGRTAAGCGHRHGGGVAAAPGHHDRRRIAAQPMVDALYAMAMLRACVFSIAGCG